MDAKQVAAYLHLHEVTVLNFARQGKLPGYKVGRVWRFRTDEIRAWLEAQRPPGETFAERFDNLWKAMRERMEAAGITDEDIPRIIAEVREARRKRRAQSGA